jgi:hypothetical protein
MDKKSLIGLFTFIMAAATCFSQSAVVSAGGHAKNNTCSVSYSVGQMAIKSKQDGNLRVFEGVQHAYEIYTMGDKNKYPDITLDAIVYPNPTDDQLILQIKDYLLHEETMVALLYDNSGHLLLTKNITGVTTQFQFGQYASGIYFLEVDATGQPLKTFKVVRK